MTRDILTINDVGKRYQVHVSTIRRWCIRGLFPLPIRIAGTSTRWRLVDLVAWEAAGCPPIADQDVPADTDFEVLGDFAGAPDESDSGGWTAEAPQGPREEGGG